MKMKKFWKRFWTMNRHHAGGFTLVELIVVIAILAIIVGVAIPVYNGYINKANQAADDQLIAVLNKAAAAAVLEVRGVDMATLSNDALTANKDPITVDDPTNANVATAFSKYFTGNETASLKYYDDLKFERGMEGGMFVGVKNSGATNTWVKKRIDENGTVYYTFTNGDKTVKVSETDLEKLKASTFMTGMDISTLTGDIDSVVRAASGLVTGSNISKVAGFSDWLAQKGIDPNDSDKVAKALVLYTAMKTQGDAATIMADVRGTQFATDFQTAINAEDKTQAFVDAAMAYAMVEAFANSKAGSNASVILATGQTMSVPDYLASVNTKMKNSESGTAALNEVLTMLSTLKDTTKCPKFTQYLNSDSYGTKDLSGYLSAMNALSGNIDNIDMDTYLSEGMSGDYITSLMEQFKTSGG